MTGTGTPSSWTGRPPRLRGRGPDHFASCHRDGVGQVVSRTTRAASIDVASTPKNRLP